jgi:hypothetical protein
MVPIREGDCEKIRNGRKLREVVLKGTPISYFWEPYQKVEDYDLNKKLTGARLFARPLVHRVSRIIIGN